MDSVWRYITELLLALILLLVSFQQRWSCFEVFAFTYHTCIRTTLTIAVLEGKVPLRCLVLVSSVDGIMSTSCDCGGKTANVKAVFVSKFPGYRGKLEDYGNWSHSRVIFQLSSIVATMAFTWTSNNTRCAHSLL